VPEPDVESFQAAWLQRSIFARAAEMVATAGESLYRLSIMRRAEGRSLASSAYLAGAAICRPRVALSRLTTRQTWGSS
jgi:hypothetical protein